MKSLLTVKRGGVGESKERDEKKNKRKEKQRDKLKREG